MLKICGIGAGLVLAFFVGVGDAVAETKKEFLDGLSLENVKTPQAPSCEQINRIYEGRADGFRSLIDASQRTEQKEEKGAMEDFFWSKMNIGGYRCQIPASEYWPGGPAIKCILTSDPQDSKELKRLYDATKRQMGQCFGKKLLDVQERRNNPLEDAEDNTIADFDLGSSSFKLELSVGGFFGCIDPGKCHGSTEEMRYGVMLEASADKPRARSIRQIPLVSSGVTAAKLPRPGEVADPGLCGAILDIVNSGLTDKFDSLIDGAKPPANPDPKVERTFPSQMKLGANACTIHDGNSLTLFEESRRHICETPLEPDYATAEKSYRAIVRGVQACAGKRISIRVFDEPLSAWEIDGATFYIDNRIRLRVAFGKILCTTCDKTKLFTVTDKTQVRVDATIVGPAR